ncbi:MAG: NFACT RNA binding domain-containing protein [Pyrinomonadaceae bacterium]
MADFASDQKRKPSEKPRGKALETNAGSLSFVSTDGFEILVGKKAKDNDYLTFRVAKSLDLWMHAADYPGSHVVIRNPNRKEIPHRTLLEAAQLAAFYSQGKSQPKAAVHYTQKKFVNKPKGAAPGLVSLASFKTILVIPEFPALPEPDVGSGN